MIIPAVCLNYAVSGYTTGNPILSLFLTADERILIRTFEKDINEFVYLKKIHPVLTGNPN